MTNLLSKNWIIRVECKFCGKEYTVMEDKCDWSKELVPNEHRLVIVPIPQNCPNCIDDPIGTDNVIKLDSKRKNK